MCKLGFVQIVTCTGPLNDICTSYNLYKFFTSENHNLHKILFFQEVQNIQNIIMKFNPSFMLVQADITAMPLDLILMDVDNQVQTTSNASPPDLTPVVRSTSRAKAQTKSSKQHHWQAS